jgi:ATP-dependent Clp protease ATP-binding subunit ClpC
VSDTLANLISRLHESMGFAMSAKASPKGASDAENVLACLTDALHAVSLVGFALLWRKPNDVPALAGAAVEALTDPSLETHVRFQSLLFPTYRDTFGQVFPVQYVGKDLMPLYLRKYLQLLEELNQIGRMSVDERGKLNLSQLLGDALTFLVNNWTGTVAVLRPSSRAPEGPQVEVVAGASPATGKIRSLSHQIRPGLYLMSENNQPLALHPFFYLEDEQAFLFRMLTSDGAFYRNLGKEGYSLVFSAPVLLDLGDFLFRAGAYDRAIQLYRLMEGQHRDAAILVSVINHCVSAKECSARGEAQRASAEWELALSVKPDVPILYHEAARDYLLAGRHAQAVGVLNRLLERFPLSDEGYMALGDIYVVKGDYGRAQRAYEKALLLNPQHPQAASKKQNVQEKLGAKAPAESADKPAAVPEEVLGNLSQKVRAKPRLSLVGREEALNQLMEILSCRDKRNALLVGEAGVGKTAVVEELVWRAQEHGAPEALRGRTVLSLNLAALISGARFRGQFEERVLEVVRRVKDKGHLLVVENLHQLVSTGTSRGSSLDSASLLKPALLEGDIQIIGTTDEESYANILEKDPGFLKNFHLLRLEELSIEQVQEVVRRRVRGYEEFHSVRFPEGLVENSLELVRLSISGRALPESVLDLMDRSAARVALEASTGRRADRSVTRHDLLRTLSEMSGVAYERLSLLDRDRLSRMEDLLSRHVVDQDEAIAKLSRLVRTAKLGLDLNPNRPDGVFLFVGPTGVGKTELARCLAELLFGDKEKLIRIDMSEYMERISTSRLIGTAPGYVGYYDQNQLTDQVRKNPYCVVLFDEVEKADPQVLNLFLQIFDAGRLTDGKGRTVRFHHATIIMTSNVGTDLFSRHKVGYGEGGRRRVEEEEILKAVREQFTPEFLNRVDEVVIFESLTPQSLCQIVDLQLEDLVKRLSHQGKAFVLEGDAREFLAREGYSFEYGARNLGRTLRRYVVEPLADLALDPRWERAAGVRVALSDRSVRLELLLPERPVAEEAYFGEDEREGEKK